jgi:hypothetical protein
MAHYTDRPERPRLEPEIIPPARGRREPGWQYDVWEPYAQNAGGTTQRLYMAKFGPFGLAMIMMGIGFVIALILLAVVGALLVWLPILALLFGAGVVYRLLRR